MGGIEGGREWECKVEWEGEVLSVALLLTPWLTQKMHGHACTSTSMQFLSNWSDALYHAGVSESVAGTIAVFWAVLQKWS